MEEFLEGGKEDVLSKDEGCLMKKEKDELNENFGGTRRIEKADAKNSNKKKGLKCC